jgi:hypothetical protein
MLWEMADRPLVLRSGCGGPAELRRRAERALDGPIPCLSDWQLPPAGGASPLGDRLQPAECGANRLVANTNLCGNLAEGASLPGEVFDAPEPIAVQLAGLRRQGRCALGAAHNAAGS